MKGRFLAGLATGIILTGSYSHYSQIEQIEKQAHEVQITVGAAQGATREDLAAILSRVNHMELEPETDYRFLVGDFQTSDGKSRCGGIARLLVEEGAKLGFSGSIELERSGYSLHYYATLSRDGETFKILNSPPALSYQSTGNRN